MGNLAGQNAWDENGTSDYSGCLYKASSIHVIGF